MPSAKLSFLLTTFGVSADQFIADFCPFSAIYRDTPYRRKAVREYLDGKKDMNEPTLILMTTYWLQRVPSITVACWNKDLEEFKTQVLADLTSPKRLEFILPEAPNVIEAWERVALPGCYRIFRYAFANGGEIALEWLVIDEVVAPYTFMTARFYSVSLNSEPPDPTEEIAGAAASLGTKGDANGAEIFVGRIYRIGEVYTGVLAYLGQPPQRTRTLEFVVPSKDKKQLREWCGLLMGPGARSGLPSCATLVAKRMNPPTTGNGSAEETAQFPVRFVMPENQEIPESYKILINNNIVEAPSWPRDEHRRDYVLISPKGVPQA